MWEGATPGKRQHPELHSGCWKGGEILMTNRRKNTPKRARRPLKPGEIAVIITAVSALLTALAALLTALK